MGYAKHIGRVGALAVTLGVGVAIATAPGIAYAEPVGSSTSTEDSPSPDSADVGSTTAKDDAAESPSPEEEPDSDTADDAEDGDAGIDDVEEAEESSAVDAEDASSEEEGEEEDAPPASDDDPGDSDVPSERNDDSAQRSVSADPHEKPTSTTATDDDYNESATTAEPPTQLSEKQSTPAPAAVNVIPMAPTTFAAPLAATTSGPATTALVAPQPRPTIVNVVRNLVAAVLRPLLSWGAGAPIQLPVLFAGLAAVRDEMERILFGRTTEVVSQQTISQLVDPADQHVLVIGVDGTNLSRILDDPENENFFELMNTSTTAASSIVGHTTISNPSWTAILTGAWDNKTGVINNVFTPWTYNKWPTVFNQLETLDSAIQTTAIANWNVINAIAGAGSIPADENIFISQLPGDTNWLATDDAIGDATVAAIADADGSAPNFLLSYFVGVDENGHLYGGASPQYAEAIRNVDDNLGEILDAVEAREASTGEDWTIIVVTDHGHQPRKGFGHGFQSPDETATFVIIDGPGFGDGFINTEYEIVDTTPTVLTLFGGTPSTMSDGVSLTTLGPGFDPGDSDALHQALRDEIAKNHYPGIVTNVALGARTIFATIPYLVFTELGSVPILGDVLYVVTNVPAQIVAFLTGVRGASIFPLLPPEPPSFPEQTTAPDALDCGSLDAAACIAS